MTFYKNKLTVLALGASLVSLSACTNIKHPNSMPSGYTYHHETYKSPAPAASSKVTIEQRKYMDATQAQQFRDAIYDLLERLTMRAGMPPKPVYVLAPDTMTAFYANLDNDLRESMRHIGYAISDTPQNAYIFTYEALPLIEKIDLNSSVADNVELTLRVFNGLSESANQLTEETGQYFIQGAEVLKIQPARYSVSLPHSIKNVDDSVTPAPVAPISSSSFVQESIPVPTVVEEPVVSVPVVEPAQVVEPFKDRTSKTVSSVPISRAPEPKIPVPIIESTTPPSSMMKPRKAVSIPVNKEPSRDDIIIINRGDQPTMAVDMVESSVSKSSVSESAMDTTENVIRKRVSNPADY